MNTQDLKEKLDNTFFAWVGPPRAYIEIEPEKEGELYFRIVYKVYAVGIEAAPDDATDYEDVLCQEFMRYFDQTQTREEREDHTGTLIWRREPRYDKEVVQRWDQMADEGRGEYVPVDPPRVRHKLSIRIYCPRLDRVMSAKLEGCETGLWLEART